MKAGKSSFTLKKSHLFLLILLSLLGFYLRIEPVIFDAAQFGYDQAIDISYVKRLVVDRKISLIGRFTGLEGVFMGPLWTGLLVIPFVLGKGNPSASVIFFSIFGTASIWITYFIVKKMLSDTSALFSAFFVALSSPFISAAHNVISPSMLTIVAIFFIWFLWEIINGRWNYFPWLGLLLGIFFQFEIGFAIFTIPATLLILVLNTKRKKINSTWLKSISLGLMLFLLTFLPQIIFDTRHEFLMTKSIVKYFSGENTSLGMAEGNFIKRIVIRFGSLQEDLSFTIFFTSSKLLSYVLIFLLLVGVFFMKKERKQKDWRFLTMILTFVTAIYLGFAIYPAPVWVWYRAGMPIFFVLLVTIFLTRISKINNQMQSLLAMTLILVALLAINPKGHLQNYVYGYQGGVSLIKNQKHALDVIFQDAREPFDLYVYTPPFYTYVWDYMIFWYAQPKYKKTPLHYGPKIEAENSAVFYLLMEPDEIPIRQEAWRNNFENFGKATTTNHVDGNIIVEKWISAKK